MVQSRFELERTSAIECHHIAWHNGEFNDGGRFNLLDMGPNQNNDLDSPHPLSIYPITGIDCIAVSSHSMYLNLYILIILREWRVGSKICGVRCRSEWTSS